MSGDRFNFDENGDTFYCFLIALFTVILLPVTYLLWPRCEVRESGDSFKKRCQCAHCQTKRGYLRSSSTRIKPFFWLPGFYYWRCPRSKLTRRHLTLSMNSEIKKAYKKLSLIHHPDRGGDEQKFIRIHKAYITLTDEVANKNWQEFGNSDGPGGNLFRRCLCNRVHADATSCCGMSILFCCRILSGLWWSNSMKYSNTKVLLVTVRLFCGSFMYNPFMAMPRLIKLLSSAYEFNSQFNKEIICRPSDNVELPPLISQIPMFTIFKRAIVGAPYAIKARALIYAHMLRLDLPPKSLSVVRAVLSCKGGSRKKMPQVMATIENCMHLTPMLVQALSPISASTPLLQLPHIGTTQLRQIRNLKTVRQIARLPDDKRRVVLSGLSEEQYRDVVSVLAAMPLVEIACRCEVS
ncbi:unnamed protein product, partial [Mesocestoides corti]